MTSEEIKTLKVARAKCDNDLLFFTRYFFKRLRGSKFITNWHHKDICKELDDIENYKLKFLNISIAPRMSKTELAGVNFIARGIGKNPASNWLYITAADDLRAETSIRIRDIVTDDHFKFMYGVELKKDQNSKNLWRTKQGGGVKTATIFGQITGFGAGQMIEIDPDLDEFLRDFEGCIVIDDINKTDDSEKLNANNEKVLRTIANTVLSRVNSPDTPIINIQQRAGMEDATSFFMELYEDDPRAKFLIYPIIRNGDSLWPWKMPMDEIMKIKNHPKTKHVFETQYMQNPMPSEGLMYPNKFKTYKELPTDLEGDEQVLSGWTFGVIDTADKGKDHFAAAIFQIVGNRMYLKDVVFDTQELITHEPIIVSKTKQHKVRKWVVETNSAGNYFTGRLRKLLPGITVFGQWSSSNKMDRILSNAGFLNEYLYVPENPVGEMDKFLQQCYRLLKTSKDKDDAPDCLSLGSAHLEKHYRLFD